MPTQVDLLKSYGLEIRGVQGQHLLIDPNMQRKIVDRLGVEEGDRVLEIGPGLGALTGELLKRKARVVAVEKDERFVRVLKKEFREWIPGRLQIVHGDILEFDFKKAFPPKKGDKIKVISNLPYYVTGPTLFHLFEFSREISVAVLTMQKEVAMRILASPGTKDYGRLSVSVRYFADAEYAFDIPRQCFTPQPEVDSSVLVLRFRKTPTGLKKKEEKFLFHLIQAAFCQRRKTLLHLLVRDPAIGSTRQALAATFKSLGFSETVRGEELLLKDFLSLGEALQD